MQSRSTSCTCGVMPSSSLSGSVSSSNIPIIVPALGSGVSRKKCFGVKNSSPEITQILRWTIQDKEEEQQEEKEQEEREWKQKERQKIKYEKAQKAISEVLANLGIQDNKDLANKIITQHQIQQQHQHQHPHSQQQTQPQPQQQPPTQLAQQIKDKSKANQDRGGALPASSSSSQPASTEVLPADSSQAVEDDSAPDIDSSRKPKKSKHKAKSLRDVEEEEHALRVEELAQRKQRRLAKIRSLKKSQSEKSVSSSVPPNFPFSSSSLNDEKKEKIYVDNRLSLESESKQLERRIKIQRFEERMESKRRLKESKFRVGLTSRDLPTSRIAKKLNLPPFHDFGAGNVHPVLDEHFYKTHNISPELGIKVKLAFTPSQVYENAIRVWKRKQKETEEAKKELQNKEKNDKKNINSTTPITTGGHEIVGLKNIEDEEEQKENEELQHKYSAERYGKKHSNALITSALSTSSSASGSAPAVDGYFVPLHPTRPASSQSYSKPAAGAASSLSATLNAPARNYYARSVLLDWADKQTKDKPVQAQAAWA